MIKTNQKSAKNQKTEKQGLKLGDDKAYSERREKTDLPDFIKPEELAPFFPFTIHSSREFKLHGADKIQFGVAYKDSEGETQKRVVTLSKNDERTQLMVLQRRNRFIRDCRIIKLHLGSTTYWKIQDVDLPLPLEASPDNPVVDLETSDIPV